MSDANEVVESMCQSYASAVNAGDSEAYSRLFTADAIRVPPGSEPEYGPEQIRQGEQADYDVAKWSIQSTPVDALQISEDWIYGIAHVDVTTTAHADGAKSSFEATKTWLLQEQPSGEWLIARQMWNPPRVRAAVFALATRPRDAVRVRQAVRWAPACWPRGPSRAPT